MPDASDSAAGRTPVAGAALDIPAFERIAAQGWQGTTVAPLGDWLLRAGHGFTGRANSVLPLGSPGVDLDEAIGGVRAFYRDAALPAVIQVPEDQPGSELDELDRQLHARGWRPYNRAAVMTAAVDDVISACPRSDVLPRSLFDPAPSAAWLSGYHYRGNPLPPTAIAVLVNARSPVFVTVPGPDPSAPVRGVARGVITQGWLGVTAVTVDEAHRRSGVGRHLMGELVRWAVAAPEPAHSIYLQVDQANSVALAMYRNLGFAHHHGYHYLADPQSQS